MTGIRFLFIFLVVLGFSHLYSSGFIYPVVVARDEQGAECVYVIHQRSLYQLELWLWDPVTTQAHKVLPSSYTPAGLRLLPDGSGFSFIDNGLVKIKKNNKRLASTLMLSDSLYEIGLIEWLDKETAYCSAKKRERFGIYHLTTQGNVHVIAASIAYDCMYPCKKGSNLFYVERSEVEPGIYNYELLCLPYGQDSSVSKDAKKAHSQAKVIADFGQQPLAFFRMSSPTQGCVIGYKAALTGDKPSFTFTYYHLDYSTHWQKRPLFSFKIPSSLLVSSSNDRIHESILPLVPSTYGNYIYFVDCHDGQTVNLYSFNMFTTEIVLLTEGPEGTVRFPAFPFKDSLYYGGALSDFQSKDSPSLVYDERGLVFITLPSL